MMAPSTAELERKIETLATGVAELSTQLDTLRDDATDDRMRVGELRADIREMHRVLTRGLQLGVHDSESLTNLFVRLRALESKRMRMWGSLAIYFVGMLLGAAMVWAAVSL